MSRIKCDIIRNMTCEYLSEAQRKASQDAIDVSLVKTEDFNVVTTPCSRSGCHVSVYVRARRGKIEETRIINQGKCQEAKEKVDLASNFE